MNNKEKAAMAVETTATNAQEGCPALELDSITKNLLKQYCRVMVKSAELATKIQEHTDGEIEFCAHQITLIGTYKKKGKIVPVIAKELGMEDKLHTWTDSDGETSYELSLLSSTEAREDGIDYIKLPYFFE